MKMLTNNHAQRVCRLLGVALLLLVHCAGSSLAMTEHHRCIYDDINWFAGKPAIIQGLQHVEKLTGVVSEVAETRDHKKTDTAEFLKKPPMPSSTSGGYKPIRIKVFMVDSVKGPECNKENEQYVDVYGEKMSCTKGDIMTPKKQEIYEHTIIPEAVKLHTDRLTVLPLITPIVVPNYTDTSVCGRFKIPENHHTEGVDNADMVLYATAAPTVDGAFAWAATCAVQPDGRPLVGVINYSPRHIARTSQAVRVAAHEIAHTLGFNVDIMDKPLRKVSEGNFRGKKIYVFDGWNTRMWGTYHYQCKNFYGMELEDSMSWAEDGKSAEVPQTSPLGLRSAITLEAEEKVSSRTALRQRRRKSNWTDGELSVKFGVSSHWKRRNAKDELMAGLVGAGHYTALTLSAFADMGYYQVDYSKAETMSWGRKVGCEFLQNKSCVTEGASNYLSMFCDSSYNDKLRCTSDRQALGKCVIEENERIPAEYSYFQKTKLDKKLGGRREDMMDYCPIIVASKGYSCVNGDRRKMPGSLVGGNSRCVKGNDLTINGTEVLDVCVQIKCITGSVYVKYAGASRHYFCPQGQFLKVQGDFGADGTIACPRYEDVCTTMLPGAESSTTSDDTTSLELEVSNAPSQAITEDGHGSTASIVQDGNKVQGDSNVKAEESETHGERKKIVMANGKNLDLKLNADGSAAASALMPLVLAVVAASAIMAH
ncbi:surface protease GP63 [Trypanosoma grayi]|uniref:surface protease GP63 n=1 Tax=Trypanosoma grayi TaxID=71804 RepID=UPI0004F49C5E|nr:surface protease GP63 [Trypanosoma grayi]KEG12605.1 surface protease GP63 [Trypanosoma grayi]